MTAANSPTVSRLIGYDIVRSERNVTREAVITLVYSQEGPKAMARAVLKGLRQYDLSTTMLDIHTP